MILKILNEDGITIKYPKVEMEWRSAFENIIIFLGADPKLWLEYNTDPELNIKIQQSMPLIAHIDPWADTYINSKQAEMYIEEFKNLMQLTTDQDLKGYCKIVIETLENIEDCTFLVFYGD